MCGCCKADAILYRVDITSVRDDFETSCRQGGSGMERMTNPVRCPRAASLLLKRSLSYGTKSPHSKGVWRSMCFALNIVLGKFIADTLKWLTQSEACLICYLPDHLDGCKWLYRIGNQIWLEKRL